MTPKVKNKPLRFTASVLGDFGLSNNFFIAPIISAGLLYTTEETADTPTGLTFNIFYRPTEINLDDVGGGKSGRLQPAFGVKVGYIFEGFWTAKKKMKQPFVPQNLPLVIGSGLFRLSGRRMRKLRGMTVSFGELITLGYCFPL